MWLSAAAVSKRWFRLSAEMLQAPNQGRLYKPVGDMPDLWDNVRASLNNPTAASPENHKKQSFLEVRKWNTMRKDPVNGLHVRMQNVLNLIGEKEKEISAKQMELHELQVIRKLLNTKISQVSFPDRSTRNLKPISANQDIDISQWKTDFDWSNEMKSSLKTIFRFTDFRPMQLEAINATMSNMDVILISTTGGGKSICYQLPALLSQGITLVVSPLVSLMEDQVMQLRKCGIQAHMLSSTSSVETVLRIYHSMEENSPDLKLLYVTPEKISKSKKFMAQLDKCYRSNFLARIAIDEVHCVTQWGNDFRPDYKALGILKRQFPNTPVIGLTATSTAKVTSDLKNVLGIPDALVLKTPLGRPNLFHEVRPKPGTHRELVADMAQTINTHFPGKSGLVYCISRRNCTDVCNGLIKSGIRAEVYHARLDAQTKSGIHRRWRNDETQVICSTIAFGMGIDKPDVRFVIHHSISKSLENYFQESGRAGRDGKAALCLLYFGFGDVFRQSSLVFTEFSGPRNLAKMARYCQSTKICRQRFMGEHFGDVMSEGPCKGKCDVCSGMQKTVDYDVTKACRALLSIAGAPRSESEGGLTANKLVDSATKKTSGFGHRDLSGLSKAQLQRIVLHMIAQEYLCEKFCFTSYAKVSYVRVGPKAHVLQGDVKVTLDFHTGESPREEVYAKLFRESANDEIPKTKTIRAAG